jgi:hypothetical protein
MAKEASRSTRRKTDNDVDRPRRIRLRPCDSRYRRERGSARDQMQKISAGKFHSALPAFRATVGSRNHSGLMLAARITLRHFSVSSAMSLPNSAGDVALGRNPRSSYFALM